MTGEPRGPDASDGVMPFPATMYLEITNRCNSKCATCVRTYDLAEPEGDVTLDGVDGLIASFPAGHAPRRVVLNGVGEALLHRDLVAIVERFTRAGSTVLFNTNAVTLTPATTIALAAAGLDELRVSIDGARRATYALIRGIDALDRASQNVRLAIAALREAGLARPKISVWFTGTRENLAELPEMVRLTRDVGADELYFQRLVFREGPEAFGVARAASALTGAPLADVEERAFEEGRRRARELGVTLRGAGEAGDARDAVRPDVPAERPWTACKRPGASTYVTAQGNVLPCCIAPFSTSDYASITLGNVRDATLAAIFHGARYAAFRARFASDDPPDCCRRCGTDWSL